PARRRSKSDRTCNYSSVGRRIPHAGYCRIGFESCINERDYRESCRSSLTMRRGGWMVKPKTIFEKIWENHVVVEEENKPALLYIDLHLVHEVTSPQAFEGLRINNRKVRRPDLTFATMDHNVPTVDRFNIKDLISKKQIDTLKKNCEEFNITLFDLESPHQGIVHVIGPELGLTQPGKTIVCGDSHTSTHGAFGALAFGIGTSEVEHVLATQTLDRKSTRLNSS